MCPKGGLFLSFLSFELTLKKYTLYYLSQPIMLLNVNTILKEKLGKEIKTDLTRMNLPQPFHTKSG